MATIAELEAKLAQFKAELAEAHALNASMRGQPLLPRALPPAEAAAALASYGLPLKLDLGCGNTTRRGVTGLTKEKGWTGVDLAGTQGPDVHCDLAKDTWPWPDNSVDEVNCAHMLEHIPRMQRVHFFNELWRVLKNGAKAVIVTPHWCSCRAYADITHEWPPISEMFWSYLNKEWRDQNAPHVGFICHFEVGYGYLTAPWLQAEVANRNAEFVTQKTNEALTKYKEAAQDMFATLTAKK